MSVHTKGPLAPTADDLRITHRGRDIALKLLDWGSSIPTLCVIEKKADKWESVYVAWQFDDRSDGIAGTYLEKVVQEKGMVWFITDMLVPEVNKALLYLFPADASNAADHVGEDYPATLSGVDSALRAMLRWAPQPDGTLKVTV